MFTTREWLTIVGIAIVGTVVFIVVRALFFAFQYAMWLSTQMVSSLVLWSLVGVAVVFFLRKRVPQN